MGSGSRALDWTRGAAALGSLRRLRWVQLVAEAIAVAVALAWAVPDAPVVPLLALLAAGVVGNLALHLGPARRRADAAAGAAMLFDVAVLTGLLALTGAASNPFRAGYLVQIVLAAMVLRPAFIAAVVAAAVAGDGLLVLLPATGHAAHMRGHLIGMWLALVGVGPFVAASIASLRVALGRADAALAAASERRARAERLASLATLAAGAAHELATPLSAIAVAAGELERRAATSAERDRADLALVRESVERCREILGQLAVDAGAGAGGVTPLVAVEDVLERAMAGVREPSRIRVEGADAALDARVRASLPLLARALRGLVDNALRAGPGEVCLSAAVADDHVALRVEDQGVGMTAEVLAHARDPFFTTRAHGQGMGLGLFVASTLAEQLGGRLELDSAPERGTRVALWLPCATQE